MNKICTTIEQSKKLIELGIDVETADMYYTSEHSTPSIMTGAKSDYSSYIPAWSLSVLLELMPFHLIVNNQRYAFSMHKGLNKDGETYMFRYNIFNTDICLYSTDYYNNSIDAAFEMVCWLKENGKL